MALKSLALTLVLAASVASAQTIPPAGDATTFDIATWNIEYFGVDDNFNGPPVQRQLENVRAVISQANIDLWAVQEIAAPRRLADPVTWPQLIAALADDGYEAELAPAPGAGVIRAGFIYDPSVVTVLRQMTVIDDFAYYFGGRQPYKAVVQVTVGGVSMRVHVITIHADGGTDEDSHGNRTNGVVKLKEYIDDRIPAGDAVIVLGDFNDYVFKARWDGCPDDPNDGDCIPRPLSPYAPFDLDPHFIVATEALEDAGTATICPDAPRPEDDDQLCGGNLTIDHIVYSSDLPDPVEVARYDAALRRVPSFVTTTSDHTPVYARFDMAAAPGPGDPASGGAAPESASRAQLLDPSPNPFRSATDLRFVLRSESDVRLEVFDVLGRSVLSLERSLGAGAHEIALDGTPLAPGPYAVRLTVGGSVWSTLITRAD